MNWIKKLRKQGACLDGLDWASEYPTAQEAWDACENANWMLWAWGRNCGKIGSKSHRQLVLACVECARTSLKYVKDKEVKKLVKKSLDTTERWARGEDGVTLENAGGYAAGAISAGYAAADAAVWTSRADAAAGAGAAAREKALKKCAGLIRKIQPLCPRFKRRVTW
jgi:predicted  nucleic acid-binding Zn-ribbon protein